MAEEHHSLVLWFLQVHGLSMEDYYDVVIFRYLLAVEKWFQQTLPIPGGFPAAGLGGIFFLALFSSAIIPQKEGGRKPFLSFPQAGSRL